MERAAPSVYFNAALKTTQIYAAIDTFALKLLFMLTPFHPFPEIQTPRLRLRKIELTDAEATYAMRSDPVTMQYLPRPIHTRLEESMDLLRRVMADLDAENGISWAICLKDDPALIGNIGLWQLDKSNRRGEIGYMLHRSFTGKGYATEALEAVEHFGFRQMDLHAIEGHVSPENTASFRVLQRRGFIQEAHFRQNQFYEGRYTDTLVFAKLNPWHIDTTVS
jgi:ribosomal-protein-alanine N-acetyltransferase